MQNVNEDDWSANANAYAQMPKDGPHILSSKILFERMNLASPIKEANTILDVGCGPGTTTAMLIELYGQQISFHTRLIASDFSKGMVEQVQERKKREDGNVIWQNVEAKVLDAHELADIKDDSVRHVMGSMVYNLVKDGRKALEAAYRVLQPGGVIALTVGASFEWMDLMALAAKCIRGESGPVFRFAKGYHSINGILGEFEAVGFKSFLRGNNPGALYFVGGYSDDEKDRFIKEWLALVDERHPEAPEMLNGTAIIAVGRK